jgi:hypothetical protein
VHWVACVGVGFGLAACAQHPPGRTAEEGTSPEKPTPAANREVSSGTVTASRDVMPEGRLALQLNSGIEVLAEGDGRSLSLGGDAIVAFDLSPDASNVLAATYVTEPTNYTREDQLFAIDPWTGERTVLGSGGPEGGPRPSRLVPRWSARCVSAHRPARRSGHGTSRGHGGADRMRRRRSDDNLAVLPGPRDSRWVRLLA